MSNGSRSPNILKLSVIQTICLYFLLTKDIIKYCLRISLTHKHSVFKLLYDAESAFQTKQRIVSFNG